MNFLHIHTTDKKDGAAISAFRFHRALLEKGYGSHIFCGRKYFPGRETSQIVPLGRFGGLANAAAGKFFNDVFGMQSFGFPSTFFIKSSERVKKWADVVILRNPHGWYLSLGILPWITRNKPVIWRLPDMWGFTGHCAYAYDCEKWKNGCGECPNLKEYPELIFDTTRFLWNRKAGIYKKLKNKLILAAPSKWLKNLAQVSPLLKDFRCEYIPPGLDLNLFKPKAREGLRKAMGIGSGDKVIMFSSFKFKHKRKGPDILIEIIKELSKKLSLPITLILTGKGADKLKFSDSVKIINPGFVDDDRRLVDLYNISDVYLSLSKADNLPNTLVEAAACGLPIVTLDSGGCSEALENGRSGYVVKDTPSVVAALMSILSDSLKQIDFSLNARRFADANFSMDKQVSSYVALTKEIIADYDRTGL